MRNLKICKILKDFDYILFSFIFSIGETKCEKMIFSSIFFLSFPSTFRVSNEAKEFKNKKSGNRFR